MIRALRQRSKPGTTTQPLAAEESAASDPRALFFFEDVVVERGAHTILELDRVAIPIDGATAIIGPSGSGKSTLLRLCNRLEAPSSGTIRYRGNDLSTIEPTELRRRVAMVFQRPTALDGTAADNLREVDPTLNDDDIEVALVRVGLDGALAKRSARDLSGGELQRLGLARSLTTRPDVLLLGEGTSALDPNSAAHIEQLVAKLTAEGITPIWVTHDFDQLVRVARNTLVVVAGRVLQHGTVRDVLARPLPEVDRFLQGEVG